MTGVGAVLDEDAVVAGHLLGDVAQQREVDGADAALRRRARVQGAQVKGSVGDMATCSNKPCLAVILSQRRALH